MNKALQTALPPEVAERLGQKKPVDELVTQVAEPKPVMRTVEADKPKPAKKPAEPARRTKGVKADLGELELGERIRQITTRMPISLADRMDIAVLRQKRTGGDLRSIQAIMLAGAERVLTDLENAA